MLPCLRGFSRCSPPSRGLPAHAAAAAHFRRALQGNGGRRHARATPNSASCWPRTRALSTRGCTVTVEKLVQMYPDGRMDILTRGQRRFEISSLNEEKDYLQAEVEFLRRRRFRSHPPELREQALYEYQELSAVASAAEHGEPESERSAAQLSTGAEPARSGFPAWPVAASLGNGAAEATQSSIWRNIFRGSAHGAREGTGADQRLRREARGDLADGRVVIRGEMQRLRTASSFAMSAAIHGSLLAWLIVAAATEPRGRPRASTSRRFSRTRNTWCGTACATNCPT